MHEEGRREREREGGREGERGGREGEREGEGMSDKERHKGIGDGMDGTAMAVPVFEPNQ